MPNSIPQRASRSRNILLIGAALLAFVAMALAVLPSRSAEAVSKRGLGNRDTNTVSPGTTSQRNFTEPLALLPPVPDTLAKWSFEGVTTTNTGTTPTVTGGAAAD